MEDPEPPDKEQPGLGCAMFAAPVIIVVVSAMDASSQRSHDNYFPDLPVLGPFFLAVAVTSFIVFPWAKAKSRSNDSAIADGSGIGKAIGTSLLICGGWLLVILGILYAACGGSR